MNTNGKIENDYFLREFELEDYNKGYFDLITQLLESPLPSYEDFESRYNEMKDTKLYNIFVVECRSTQKVVGTISVVIEFKFLENLSKVAHIEDFVVDEKYRGKSLGRVLIEKAIQFSKETGCIKTKLHSRPHVQALYEKFGFVDKGPTMVLFN